MGTCKSRLAEAVPTSTHNLSFEQKYENYQNFSSESFHFLVVKFSVYLIRRLFLMVRGDDWIYLVDVVQFVLNGDIFFLTVWFAFLHIMTCLKKGSEFFPLV